ncbi:MAG: thiamine phosphate synthase [Lachnospiraceae bacterium]|jgi:thiamine-phosphate pyrophosphorylase|nr:thiamine phosphate synthase [Lachnospiraceae bacterium]
MERCLYLIADFSYGEEVIAAVLEAGIDYIQLREKQVSSAEYLARAKKVRQMATHYGTKFIVNDRLDIAALSDADGVHLGQSDIPVRDARDFLGATKIIGATAKTPGQAVAAKDAGADYLGSGAWFPTGTKQDAVPITEETYRSILKAAKIPNIAVGGITAGNCQAPLACGANGLAISAGILKAQNPAQEAQEIRRILGHAGPA